MTKPTIPDVLPLVRALYARPGGSVGCCLHVILDEPNPGLGSALWCLEYARKIGHSDCIELAEILVQMSRTQRNKLESLT